MLDPETTLLATPCAFCQGYMMRKATERQHGLPQAFRMWQRVFQDLVSGTGNIHLGRERQAMRSMMEGVSLVASDGIRTWLNCVITAALSCVPGGASPMPTAVHYAIGR